MTKPEDVTRSSFLLFAAVAGCVHAAPQPVFVPPVCGSAPAPVQKAAAPTAPHASACFRHGRPKAIEVQKKEEAPFCAGIDGAELARVEARIRKDLVVHWKPSKLVIDFGCDVLAPDVRDVVLEDGSGHGGTLRIAHFVRGPSSVNVRLIASSHYYNAGTVISTARMGPADFDALVAHARVAVLARPHLIPLAQPPNTVLGGSASFSSNDFHLRLALTDDAGHVIDRSFTGYDSSMEQEAVVPMRIATERFEAAIDSLQFAPEAGPTDADKELFARRFLAAMKNDALTDWWVRERFVALAGALGTVDIVPALAQVAEEKGAGAADRNRPVALAAIATLTGWDPRKDDMGKVRAIDDAAALAAQECAP